MTKGGVQVQKKSVTISDIAKACGTSTVTVSKALGGKSGVGDEMREKIRQTADEMGYIPIKTASVKFSGTMGVLIHEKFINPNGSFYWALYIDLLACMKSENISCIQENITFDEEKKLVLPNMVINGRVDGIISLGQLDVEYVEKLRKHNPNLVLLDYYIPDFEADSISTNGYLGGYKLTEYLIKKGHKKIGYIGNIKATTSIFDRYMGYLKAMIENGISTNDEWLISDRGIDGIPYENIDFPNELPTAFVCNCDETAFAAMRSLKSRGISVPDDISVVGYDNYLISEISEPPITTIDIDARKIAELAVATLISRISSPSQPVKQQIINGKLVEKGSVKPVS